MNELDRLSILVDWTTLKGWIETRSLPHFYVAPSNPPYGRLGSIYAVDGPVLFKALVTHGYAEHQEF